MKRIYACFVFLIAAAAIGQTPVIGLPSASGMATTVPASLQYLGDGSESAPNCTSGCTVAGEHWYASITVPAGQTMINNNPVPLILRSTGTCTIAGTISVSVNTGGAAGIIAASNYGGGGGGGGFGAANGTAGTLSSPAGGGAAGTSGVSGGNGQVQSAQTQRTFLASSPNLGGSNQAGALNLVVYGGTPGGAGGSSGGAGGKGGGMVILACATISFTGTIDASGQNGGAGGANTGGGGGGGGGIVILRALNLTNSGTINTAAGTGGVIGTGTSTAGGNGGAGWSKAYSQ
jgi:hypothetical protein